MGAIVVRAGEIEGGVPALGRAAPERKPSPSRAPVSTTSTAPATAAHPGAFEFNPQPALLAAVLASIALTLIYDFLSILGLPRSGIGSLLATVSFPEGGPVSLLLAVCWNYLIGFAAVSAYAGVVHLMRQRSTRGSGAWFGVILWAAATWISAAIVDAHPLTSTGELTVEGGRAWVLGILDFGAYLTFGIVAGSIYTNRSGTEAQPGSARSRPVR